MKGAHRGILHPALRTVKGRKEVCPNDIPVEVRKWQLAVEF